MSVLKHRIAAAFAIVTVASVATFLQVQASHETDDQFGEDAVWSASSDELSEIGKACKSTQANAYNQCFIDEMGGYASSEAVAFSQLLTAQKKPSYIACGSLYGEGGGEILRDAATELLERLATSVPRR